MDSPWKLEARGGRGGAGFPQKISTNFINFNPLKKPNFEPHQYSSLSSWVPFEHFSTKMGYLDIEPLYSMSCPSIISACST